MSRIRSIHPGLFTDEAFMSASPMARLLLIGIWTEAWDDGVFEWKPLKLKARIFPADNVDAVPLLAELVSLDVICQFENGERSYGAIRNFQKFQRPKKPNKSEALPKRLEKYVGKSATSSEPVPNQFPTSTEIAPQREEGGGNKKEEDALRASSAREPNGFDNIQTLISEAAGEMPCAVSSDISPIVRLTEQGWNLEGHILPGIRDMARQGKRAGTWLYVANTLVGKAADIRAGPPPDAKPEPASVRFARKMGLN